MRFSNKELGFANSKRIRARELANVRFLGQHDEEYLPDWAMWDYQDMEDSLLGLLRDESNVEKQEKFIYLSTATLRR